MYIVSIKKAQAVAVENDDGNRKAFNDYVMSGRPVKFVRLGD